MSERVKYECGDCGTLLADGLIAELFRFELLDSEK